jgi:hypothetical protein
MLLEKILLNQQKMDGIMSVDFKALSSGASAFTNLASCEVKATYSGEKFKTLLQQKYSFPPNITISDDLDLTICGGLIESLSNEFPVEGVVYPSVKRLPVLTPENTISLTSLPPENTMGLTLFPQGLTPPNLNFNQYQNE